MPYTPQQVQKMVGITPHLLRLWRSRGQIADCGDLQPNGRWSYEIDDVVALAVFSEMTILAPTSEPIWILAKLVSLKWAEYADGFRYIRREIGVGPFEVSERLAILYTQEDGEPKFGLVQDLGQISGPYSVGYPGAYIFDLWKIARKIPADVTGLFIEAQAN